MTPRRLLLPTLLLLAACREIETPAPAPAPTLTPWLGFDAPAHLPPFVPPPGAFTLMERDDQGCDGVAETTTWMTWEAAGERRYERTRYNPNGAEPSCKLWWRSGEGVTLGVVEPRCDGEWSDCVVRRETLERSTNEIDEGCDGTVERRSLTLLDQQQRPILQSVESSPSSASPQCNHQIEAYAAGERRPTTSVADEDCDGVLDYCRHPLLDAQGRNVGKVVDEGCDGVLESCTLATLGGFDSVLWTPEGAPCRAAKSLRCRQVEQRDDPRGVWTFEARDHDCDGAPDNCNITLTNPQGDVSARLHDGDCDGIPNQCETLETIRDGGLTTTTTRRDDGCDGTEDLCTRKVDREDRPLVKEEDVGCDGIPETCFFAHLDDHGQVRSIQNTCDASLQTSCVERRYNDAGQILSARYDDDCDGTPDRCEASTWHPLGPRLSFTQDRGCDGTPDHCIKATPFP